MTVALAGLAFGPHIGVALAGPAQQTAGALADWRGLGVGVPVGAVGVGWVGTSAAEWVGGKAKIQNFQNFQFFCLIPKFHSFLPKFKIFNFFARFQNLKIS